jgi:hypothetical protein
MHVPVVELQTHALIRQAKLDEPFLPRFICRTCGPTNRVVGGPEGFVCMTCDNHAAYQLTREAQGWVK